MGFRQTTGVMRQQQHRIARVLQDAVVDVRRPPRPEPNARQFQRFAAQRYAGALVVEDRESAPGQFRGNIVVVIVVA